MLNPKLHIMSKKCHNAAQGRTHEVAKTTKPELYPPTHNRTNGSAKTLKSGPNYEGQNISHLDFVDSDLRKANFNHVDIHTHTWHAPQLCSLFIGADLSYATLRHANLRYCYFYGTILVGADLRGADLRGAIFENVKLSHADFRGTDLSAAKFDGCYLCKTNLVGAVIHNTSFNGATFYKAQSQQLPFSDTQLKEIRTRYRDGEKPKSIYQYDENFVFQNQYSSLLEAETHTGMHMSLIKMSCDINQATNNRLIMRHNRWSYTPIQK